MQCIVEGITHNGEGVARIDGKVTFIPFAIPGETVEVEIAEHKKSFLRANLVEVVAASPDRVQPPCPYYYQCGGCAYQHVNYPRQLDLKRQVVQANLRRIGRVEAEVSPVQGMDNPWRYRNKVEWHTGRISGQLTMGYYGPNGRELVGIDSCLLINQEMDDLSRYLKYHLQELRVPPGCEITLRQSSANQEIMLIFKGPGSSAIDFVKLLNHQEVASIYSQEADKTRLHYGDTTLPERIKDIDFQVSPLAFFQVNHIQTELLVDTVIKYSQLRENYSVLDAYCGTGSIALSIAKSVHRVVGVENNKLAIKDAKRNAFTNSIANCKFIKGACEEIVPGLDEPFDVVILDPPRAGCKRELIEAIIKISPQRVIYVSCNPSTLARDLAVFVQADYEVKAVQAIDMFPQTSHIETVVCLEGKHTPV